MGKKGGGAGLGCRADVLGHYLLSNASQILVLHFRTSLITPWQMIIIWVIGNSLLWAECLVLSLQHSQGRF
jgi:hypothetical protein